MKQRTTIGEEIKQTRPFANKPTEAAIALLRTASILKRKGELIVGKEGLSLQQYNVLRILRGARGPLPTMELASRMVDSNPAITRIVNSLEQKGLILRDIWPGDRRQVLCQITAAGLRVLERLDPEVDEYDTASCGSLGENEIDALLTYLAEIRAANSLS